MVFSGKAYLKVSRRNLTCKKAAIFLDKCFITDKNQKMKRLSLLLLSFLFAVSIHSQILKKLGKDLKNDVQWKLRSKANQKMDQALDTILAQPKKINSKETTNKTDNSSHPKAEIKTSSKEKDAKE